MVRKAVSDFLPDIPPGPVSADQIVAEMLEAVIQGRLRAGTSVHDESIARHLEISRTPVREAFLRLRALGVVETAASRYTRVSLVPPAQTAAAYDVWVWLLRMLVREVVPTADPELIATMGRLTADYSACLGDGRYDEMAAANFQFFAAPVTRTSNRILADQIRNVVYILRLGDTQLPEHVDLDLIGRAHAMLMQAFTDRDATIADRACDLLAGLAIPGVDDEFVEDADEQMVSELLNGTDDGPREPHSSAIPDLPEPSTFFVPRD
jgi:DNA-binding GntR family transcriptional regulator